MRVSGFYMINSTSMESAKVKMLDIFENDIGNRIKKVYGYSEFKVIDVIRTPEYDEGKGLKAYDVHFILEMPGVNIEEGTPMFYELERSMLTGLGIIDKDEDLENKKEEKIMKKIFEVPVTWEVYGKVKVEAETLEEAMEIVRKDEEDIPLPTDSYYVDDSFRLSSENIDEMKIMME